MIKILITAGSIQGSVELVYGEHGMGAETYPPLLSIDFSGAQLTDKQKAFIGATAPVRYGVATAEVDGVLQEFTWLDQWGKAAQALRFTEMEEEPDFDRDFWTPYDNKQNRPRSEKEWKKTGKVDRVLVVAGVRKYLRYLVRVGYRSKMLPDRFLREKHWQTDWDNLTT